MRLCGISSRFQLLSPCTRQVTHALLTRPPLSHKIISPEGNQIKCFVRLACVKHAASVHPEPGSNSHVKKLISVKLNLANSFIQIESEFTVLKVFNFHWSVLIDSQNLSRFLTVQLSMFFVLLSCDSLIILSNRCSFVKHFLFFWTLFQVLCLATACLFYQNVFHLSRTFFNYFM